ncbi:MAG: hypothetical protein MUE41_07090 [Gemmatimonadaceae bacterium]|nr:hypothetical protein [Gemmatimonadaceae bacterium]
MSSAEARPRLALVGHAGDELNIDGLARWLGSFADLTLLVRIHEPLQRKVRRVRRELQRVGAWRMADVMAYKVIHQVRYRRADAEWHAALLETLRSTYPPARFARTIDVPNANDAPVQEALRADPPDLMIARCKQLLAPRIFEVPRAGTVVLHPGICPEYRNAHGGFWALATGHPELVGTTLLRIDRGVDTGPVFAYFTARGSLDTHSHIVLQNRTLFDNLPAVQAALEQVIDGLATPVDVRGRTSAEWGQPWLTAWRRARRAART